MGLFDFFKKKNKTHHDVLDIPWSKNKGGKFRRLPFLEIKQEHLDGIEGIYIVWHGGAKPGWVYVGMTDDLAMDLHDVKQNKDIMSLDVRGGLFVTWQTFPASQAKGIFAFLSDVLQPEVRNPDAESYRNVTPIKIIPPGYTKDTFSRLF